MVLSSKIWFTKYHLQSSILKIKENFNDKIFFPIGDCPSGWLNAEELSGCYIFAIGDGTGLNWQQSKDYCESIGGFLTDILNQETQDFLANSGFIQSNPAKRWWIGGNDIQNVSNINMVLTQFISLGHEVLTLYLKCS